MNTRLSLKYAAIALFVQFLAAILLASVGAGIYVMLFYYPFLGAGEIMGDIVKTSNRELWYLIGGVIGSIVYSLFIGAIADWVRRNWN